MFKYRHTKYYTAMIVDKEKLLYYDGQLTKAFKPIYIKYPNRYFYKRKYKTGDRVKFLIDAPKFKKGQCGTIHSKSKLCLFFGNLGEYNVVLDYEDLPTKVQEGIRSGHLKGYGVEINAKGIELVK